MTGTVRLRANIASGFMIHEGKLIEAGPALVVLERTALEHWDGKRFEYAPLVITFHADTFTTVVISAITDGDRLMIDPDELREATEAAGKLGIPVEARITTLTPADFSQELCSLAELEGPVPA